MFLVGLMISLIVIAACVATVSLAWFLGYITAQHINKCNDQHGCCVHIGLTPEE